MKRVHACEQTGIKEQEVYTIPSSGNIVDKKEQYRVVILHATHEYTCDYKVHGLPFFLPHHFYL